MSGRVWLFGDDVNTDAIISTENTRLSDPAELASCVLQDLRPDFAAGVQPGDFIVAGQSFGSGSSREHAAVALRATGIAAILADSFARIFYRNAFNNGLPVIEVPGLDAAVADGDQLVVDLASGVIEKPSSGERWEAAAVPPFLAEMCRAGGLVPWLKSTHGEWSLTPN